MKHLTPRKAFGTLFGALALSALLVGGFAVCEGGPQVGGDRAPQSRLAGGGDGQETHGGKGGKGRAVLVAGDGQETHGGKGGKGLAA